MRKEQGDPRSHVVLRVDVPRTTDHHLTKQVDMMVEFLDAFGSVTIVDEVFDSEEEAVRHA